MILGLVPYLYLSNVRMVVHRVDTMAVHTDRTFVYEPTDMAQLPQNQLSRAPTARSESHSSTELIASHLDCPV